MPRIGSIIERVQIDLQRAVDEIETRNDERPEGEPSLRVADVEVEVPFDVDDSDGGDTENGDSESGDADGLNIVPGGTGGSFRLQLTPGGAAPTRDSQTDEDGGEPPSPIAGLGWSDLGTQLDPSVIDAIQGAAGSGAGSEAGSGAGSDADSGAESGSEESYDHPILLPGGDDGQEDEEPDQSKPNGGSVSGEFGHLPVHHVKSIGPKYEARLGEYGIERIEDLASAEPERLADRTGLSPSRTKQFVRRAQMMALGANEDDAALIAALGVEPTDLASVSADQLIRIIGERSER
ncbi:MAG: hypothetical protein A07HR67_00188, partial [uncultured archaeon A07HR67]